MSEFELPRNLVANDADGGADPAWRAWVAALPTIVDDLSRRWSVRVGRPFQPGGAGSWTAPVSNEAGEHLVLKVGWRHDEALHEADGLRVWAGRGAVRLLDAAVFGRTSALLLEACRPGTVLSEALPPLEQDVVAADLLRRLWIDPPAGHPFRPLRSMCDAWADEFDARYAAATSAGGRDPGLARAGAQVLRDLPLTATRDVLLCTDLHPGNVLAAEREPWLVIDPKPYLGDPAYDPVQYMLNFSDRLVADPRGFARRMADLLDLDPGRVRGWLFARCAMESVDQPHLWDVAVALAP